MAKNPDKYVVLHEIPDYNYLSCVGVYDEAEAAYGEAYLTLVEDTDDESGLTISVPKEMEADNGFVLEARNKQGDLVAQTMVLFYTKEEKDG